MLALRVMFDINMIQSSNRRAADFFSKATPVGTYYEHSPNMGSYGHNYHRCRRENWAARACGSDSTCSPSPRPCCTAISGVVEHYRTLSNIVEHEARCNARVTGV